MSKHRRIKGEMHLSDNQMLRISLPVIVFEEDKSHVYYCPALDLSGYGATEKEAEDSLAIVMEEYFKYTHNKGTLQQDLTNLGWTLKKNLKKKAVPPTTSHLLEHNENFKNIFDNYNFRKTDTPVQIPALV